MPAPMDRSDLVAVPAGAAPPPLGDPYTESDADFWNRQFTEHGLFLTLLLEDVTLAQRAKALEIRFRDLQKQMQGKGEHTKLSMMHVPVLELRAFKTSVLERLNRGEWLGWAFPIFVEHIRNELDYFLAKAYSLVPLTPNQEMCAWLRFLAEHAALASHLIDPSEGKKIQEAVTAWTGLVDLHKSCEEALTPTFLKLSKKAGQELDDYLIGLGIGTTKPTKSIIHPVLAIHVVREGRRFLATLEKL